MIMGKIIIILSDRHIKTCVSDPGFFFFIFTIVENGNEWDENERGLRCLCPRGIVFYILPYMVLIFYNAESISESKFIYGHDDIQS